jgi:putative membrane protein
MLWLKSFHLFFVVAWFAGLFYLPRLFVNLAMEEDHAAVWRLLWMARRLFRFMTLIAILACSLGMWLWLGFGIGRHQGWLYAKLVVVVLLIVYHATCGSLLAKFEAGRNEHSHRWYRIFNELPSIGLLAAIVLAIIKPF